MSHHPITTTQEGVLNEIISKIQKSLEYQPHVTDNNTDIRSIIKSEVLSLIRSEESSVSFCHHQASLGNITGLFFTRIQVTMQNADEATVTQLEQNIQRRLSSENSSPQPPSLRALRRLHCQIAATSEWTQIDRYKAMLQAQQDRIKSLEIQQRKEKAQQELKEQVSLLLAQKQKQKEQKAAELQRTNDDVRAWRQAEIAARDARRATAKKLRDERQHQLDDLHRRQEIAHLLKRAMDARLVEELCAQAKRAGEAEAQARDQARREFDLIKENNRAAEKARKEARRAEQELEQKYMEQYAEILARQEAQRQAQQERIKAIQAAQAADAATRPSFKRWMDPELIERQAAASEEKMRAQEAERRARAAATAAACHMEIAAQLQERQRAQASALQAKAKELQAVNAAVAAAKADEVKEMQQSQAVSRRFKDDLDAQLSENKTYVTMVAEEGMNEEEERLNARILREMNQANDGVPSSAYAAAPKRGSSTVLKKKKKKKSSCASASCAAATTSKPFKL